MSKGDQLLNDRDHKVEVDNMEVEKVSNDSSEEKKKRKKEKKEKRRLEREQAESVRDDKTSTEAASEVSSYVGEKRKLTEDAAEDSTEKKKKKSKKDKREKSENEDCLSSSETYFYREHSTVTNMSSKQVSELRSNLQIQFNPEEEALSFKPLPSFDCLYPSLDGRCPYINAYLKKMNFQNPSPIQAQCWPPLLAGRDVIGIATTGSGKTLAFLIPAMLKLTYLNNGNTSSYKFGKTPKPKVLIVAPTRELAMQSFQVVTDISGPKGVCIYGGVSKSQQKQDLQAGAEIVVATPGRLLDLVQENALSLSEVCYLVLDEADRMLDDGFEPAIRQILASCPASGPKITDRQTVMFSATWPEEIRSLADKYLKKDVIRVTIGSDELSANHRVTQIVECVEMHEKDRKLAALLEKYHHSRKNRVLIFVLYKKEASDLQAKLASKGYNVTAIHGDKSQYDRTQALEEFKSGKIPLLIATDVAARGLDIPQVEYVLNYSFPLTVEDYIHRIGRTGRGGATGTSHTFFTDNDKGLAGALVAVLQEANQEVPQSIFKYQMVTKKKTSKLYGDFGPKAELAGKKSTKITFD